MELTPIMKSIFRIPCNSGWLFHGFLAGRLLDNVSVSSPIQDVFWVLHSKFLACVLIQIGLPRIGTLNEAQTSNYARIIPIVSILSPQFSILSRTDPCGHSRWQ